MAMSKTKKIILAVVGILFVAVVAAVIGIAVWISSVGKPDVPDNSVLVLKISGSMPDYVPDDPVAKLFGSDPSQSFSSLLTQL